LTDIATWLATLGLEKYSDAFIANEVDLATLSHLTDQDLRELGLPLGPAARSSQPLKEVIAHIGRRIRRQT
jgi:hypothetical protein